MAWRKFPYPDPAYEYTAAGLKQAWTRLHAGDAEPFPETGAVVEAWIAFHAGQFEQAARIGLGAGVDGYSVAHKATCIYATYLERTEKKKVALFEEVAERCERHQAERPALAAAYYWQAYALGRYAQSISVIKALAQGIAPKVRAALETTIRLAPAHADAHIALGVFHTEIIRSVGALVGGLTYGAKKEDAYKAFKKALALNPASAIARIEYANALATLDGNRKMDEAVRLYQAAAAADAQDAMERLDVEAAKEELEEDE